MRIELEITLQNSIILSPREPMACPIAGEGAALPAGNLIRTKALTPDMTIIV